MNSELTKRTKPPNNDEVNNTKYKVNPLKLRFIDCLKNKNN